MKTQDDLKKVVGEKAAALVEEGMLVGLGTGSTASHFIESLIKRVSNGLSISAVSSSERSTEMARKGGIKILDINQVTSIDLTVDGADELDPTNRMIKGGGGALVREKIVASSSKQIIIIIDESKLVDVLGKFGLPVEILPFGYSATIHKLEAHGYSGQLRKKGADLYITDNGNYIYDVHTPTQFPNPERDHDVIVNLPGVVDTGFFFNLPVKCLIGYQDGRVEWKKP